MNLSEFKPLTGRTIIDCSQLLPGPFVGKLLAEKGARVIKVENPDRPDPAREMAGGAYYEDINQLKELCWLNLTREQDQIKFRELVKSADGLIEGFRPAARKKLGLQATDLHSVNPHLCIVSIQGFDEQSIHQNRPGHDINFQALSGVLSLYSEMPGLPLSDYFAGYEAALALIAAMDACQRGEKGVRIAINIVDALKKVQSKLFEEYRRTGEMPTPGETLVTGKYPCYWIYHSKDKVRIAVGAIETKFWNTFCEIIELPEYKDRGLSTGVERDQIREKVQDKLGSKPWSYWAPLFQKAECCVEPVLNYKEVLNHGL